MAGLVGTQRDGKFIHYSIEYPKIANAVKAINKFLDEDEEG